jgi:Co/Zn/Cd efflux system component
MEIFGLLAGAVFWPLVLFCWYAAWKRLKFPRWVFLAGVAFVVAVILLGATFVLWWMMVGERQQNPGRIML